MISVIASVIVLVIGYFTYGKFVDKVFGPDNRKTPAYKYNDGVDFVPLSNVKSFLIQLLNIAGTGPIFGALMGAVFGPIVFLWIVFGSILGGAVHDYMTGMISCRFKGASIAELSGKFLGKGIKWIIRAFCILLLVLVGAVFVTSPAALLDKLTPDVLDEEFWVIVIIVYYFLATLVPIDKLIGRIYPFFGAVLILMTVGILCGTLIYFNVNIPEITLENMHPEGLPVWPFMFITVACGAISGFHATQSPMISKCIKHEKYGRKIFYGAMISEGIIALAWAAAGVIFYETTGGLQNALSTLGQSGVVYEISITLLGPVGGVLAVIGVIACPITSGDTALRSARLIIAEITHLDQKKIKNRLLIAIPIFLFGFVLTLLDFDVLWRYFSWSNQTLAMLALWVFTVFLMKYNKHKFASLITALPATFMTAVSFTYILMAQEGLRQSAFIAYPIGISVALALFVVYIIFFFRNKKLLCNN